MARPLRLEFVGGLYHLTSRGDGREAVFLSDGDREDFLKVLGRVVDRYGWICHGYCLMGNHYHLLVETPEANLSRGMRQLNGVYTQRFNYRHHRVGHVFQGRFKSIIVDREGYLLELCRYVVLNPVRAKMVEKPEDWPYSSYRATAGLGKAPPFLAVDWILGQFGRLRKNAQRSYRKFVLEGIGRESPWKNLKGQFLLGDEEFLEKMGKLLEGKEDLEEIPRVHRYASRPGLVEVVEKGVKKGKDLEKRVHQAFSVFGYTQKEIADHLGLHRSTVSLMIKRREG